MEVAARKELLEEKLNALGLQLRDDSRLCTRFVFFGVGDADEIAATMHEMEWFYVCTRYRQALAVIRRENVPYFIDRDALSAMAKRRALRWLVRAGDEAILSLAPTSLAPEIERARFVVGQHA